VSGTIMAAALELPTMSSELKQRVFRAHVAGKTGLRSFLSELSTDPPYDPVKDFERIAGLLAEQRAVNGEMVIAAAVVVLSHSMTDDVFTAACGLAIELGPTGWIPDLNPDRHVTLKTLREKGAEEVFRLELERFRRLLPAKSLPNRADLFFRHVPIRHDTIYTSKDAEYFQQSKLEEADELRNGIVHGSGLPQIDLELSRNTMLFLHEAALTALRSLAYAYKIPVDATALLGGKTMQRQPDSPEGSAT